MKTLINLTLDERNQFEQCIYLPMALMILEKNCGLAEKNFKMYEPFVAFFDSLAKDVRMKLKEVEREMKRNRMKVKLIEQDELFTLYSFQIRGYEEKHSYFNFHMRNVVEKILTRMLVEKKEALNKDLL